MKQEKEISEGRRNFLLKLSMGLGGLAALGAGIPVIGALFNPLIKKHRQTWREVAKLDGFAVGSTELVKFTNANNNTLAGKSDLSAAWLRRDSENEFTAFSINCTHLGCPIRWEKGADLFMCPCHGGVYYKDGSVAAGPPPKPLVQYEVRAKNGKIEIQTAPVPITKMIS